MPLRVGQVGAVEVLPLAVDGELAGVVDWVVHAVHQALDKGLRVAAGDLIGVPDPVEVVLPGGVGGADDIGAVPADDDGVELPVVLVEGDEAVQVAGRDSGHQGAAVPPAAHGVPGADAQEDDGLPVRGGAHGGLVLPGVEGGQEGLRVHHVHPGAADHLVVPVLRPEGHGQEGGGGVVAEQLVELLRGPAVPGTHGLRQVVDLVQAEPQGALTGLGGLLAHLRHIEGADGVDGVCVPPVHVEGQEAQKSHAQGRHHRQAHDEEPDGACFCPPPVHFPHPSW